MRKQQQKAATTSAGLTVCEGNNIKCKMRKFTCCFPNKKTTTETAETAEKEREREGEAGQGK